MSGIEPSLLCQALNSIMAFGNTSSENNVLNEAVEHELLTWDLPENSDDSVPSVDETGELRIANRRAKENENVSTRTTLPVRICAYHLSSEVLPQAQAPQRSFFAHTDIPMRRPAQDTAGLPARFTASSVGSEGLDADILPVSVHCRISTSAV